VRRRGGWLAALAIIGCSNLTDSNGGVVALGLRLPVPPAVEPDDTLTLIGYALNVNGDTVDTPVYWRTLDDTLLTVVDSIGLVTTTRTSGQARVQARVGSLQSDVVTLLIRPRSDTLRLTAADTITVPVGDSASGALAAAVESRNPAGGVSGTSILFEVVDSVAARDRVRFANGLLTYRATTATTGAPTTAVVLYKVTDPIPPMTVQVRISATRPSKIDVPGSGQQFTVIFQ
jgi:hypothetical protein